MIIDNPEALNTWLLKSLESLCEADPAALAKYVMALVKKDKPEKELREFCCDQLEIFLSGHTKPFVELLFNALRSKSYLQPSSISTTTNNMPPTESNSGFTLTADVSGSELTTSSSSYQISSSLVHNRSPVETTNFLLNTDMSGNGLATSSELMSNEVAPSMDLSEETDKRERIQRSPSIDFDRKESRRIFRKRSRSLSSSSDSSASYRARRRSRGSDESGHRVFSQKYPVRQEDSRRHASERVYSDFDSQDRGRDRKGKHEFRRRKSPSSGARSRSGSSDGNYFGSSRSRSRSRSRSDSRTRSKEKSRSSTGAHDEADLQKPSIHSSIDYRDRSPLSDSVHSSSAYDSSRRRRPVRRIAKRCKDYDEKGFCMQGEFCPYDHGVDPLVVEDVSVLNYGSPSSRTTSFPPPEPYNPEAPGMFQQKSGALPPAWPYTTPPPMTPFPLPSVVGRIPPFDPSQPPPRLPFHTSKAPMTRELITVPTLDITTTASSMPSIASTVNVPAAHEISVGNEENTTVNATETADLSAVLVQREPFFKRRNYDQGRGRTRRPINKWSDRCTLELRKVPRHLNSSNLLNAHFSKFGKIKISVCAYDNDPEAALVVFETNASANAAYRSSEPVLNNRFIRVFWHNPDSRNPTLLSLPPKEEKIHLGIDEQVVRGKSLEEQNVTDINTTEDKMRVMPLLKREAVEPAEAPSVIAPVPTVPYVQPKMLRRCNYSSVAINSNSKSDPQKETMKKRLELLKKMQSTLQTLVENQKLFLEKYSNSKSEKEKQFLKESIESTDQKILDLKDSIKKESECIKSPGKSPTGDVVSEIEIKKQLLDAEMDLYKMQRSGDDVSELAEKVRILKQKVLSLGIVDIKGLPSTRGSALMIRGRGAGRGKRGMLISRRVDHRPKKLRILNAHGLDKTDLTNHFAKFGSVEGLALDGVGALVAFRTRKEAENALSLGSRCGPYILNMTWYLDSIFNSEKVPVVDTSESSTPVVETQIEQDQSLEDEEDDDEDNESRSWRR